MAETKTPPFYMVYVNGERFPQFKHPTYDVAVIEAKRLSDLTKKESFVISPIISFKPMEHYVTTEYKTDDLPF